MFRRASPNRIVSDEGFFVEVVGPSEVLYAQGDHRLSIESEFLAGPHALAIYPSSIRYWDAPHEAEVIDDSTRKLIVDRVKRAFDSTGVEIEII